MGGFQGFDPARVRDLAGHLESVAGSVVPMHSQLSQLLQDAAADVAPQQVTRSPELQPVVDRPGVPMATGAIPISRVYGIPTGYLPGPRTQGEALAGGPLPGSVDPFLRQTAADIRSRCDRLEQVRKAAPPSVELDAGALFGTEPVDLNGVPKPTDGPEKNAAWWAGLTPAQREQYLYLKPEALETLKGLPDDVRRQATRLAYFKVVPYKIASHESGGSTKFTLGIVELGDGFAFRTEQISDGSYRVTLISNGQAGLKAGTKASAAFKYEFGDTWVFRNKAEADKLQADLKELLMWRMQMSHGMSDGARIYAARQYGKLMERLPDPRLKVKTAGGEVSGAIGVGSVTPGIKFGANFSTITSTIDPGRPSVTQSRDFTVEPSLTRGNVVKGDFGTVVNGTIQVVRDKNNPDPNTNITTVRLIQTVENKLGGTFGGELGGKKVGVSGSYREGRSHTHVVTVNVPIGADPAEQAAARKWLNAPAPASLASPVIPDKPPAPDADLISRLAHDRGQVSAVSYRGKASELKLGGKFTVEGIPFGFEATAAEKGDHVVGQQYLGAPDPKTGRRAFVPLG
ncbi:hypothetical protein ACH4LN_01650 [Streptomyces albus]|uniref:Uncharacterized protein n=1 Tax=Streptomyces albus TaxID=1888 RepID=A0A8H1LM24_9ACTN|nr:MULTISPECIES: hypothetical protein [Streptomyces]EPD91607.1 hypothetical protein HMPREF1486_04566 [Streptomyces sp. HPH0547]TGG86249.1 hypothetical protein D8771_07650 [Streptomyces albus]UVN53421.1 hypothetical protein NR995_02040 [Streptomyces albus]